MGNAGVISFSRSVPSSARETASPLGDIRNAATFWGSPVADVPSPLDRFSPHPISVAIAFLSRCVGIKTFCSRMYQGISSAVR